VTEEQSVQREESETQDRMGRPESWEKRVSPVTQVKPERRDRRERLVDKVCQDFPEHQDHAVSEDQLDPSV